MQKKKFSILRSVNTYLAVLSLCLFVILWNLKETSLLPKIAAVCQLLAAIMQVLVVLKERKKALKA